MTMGTWKTKVSPMLSDNRLEYSDMIERAHPTDGRLDWGRFQRVSARHKFVGGELVPLTPNVGAKRRDAPGGPSA